MSETLTLKGQEIDCGTLSIFLYVAGHDLSEWSSHDAGEYPNETMVETLFNTALLNLLSLHADDPLIYPYLRSANYYPRPQRTHVQGLDGEPETRIDVRPKQEIYSQFDRTRRNALPVSA